MFSDGYETYCHVLIAAAFEGRLDGQSFGKNACDCVLASLPFQESASVKQASPISGSF